MDGVGDPDQKYNHDTIKAQYFIWQGLLSKLKGNLKDAIYNFNKANELFPRRDGKYITHDIYTEIELTEKMAHQIEVKAIAFTDHEKLLDICREIQDFWMEAEIVLALGWVKECKGDYNSALIDYLGSLRIFNEIKDNEGKVVAFILLESLQNKMNNLEAANQYHQQSLDIIDDIVDNNDGIIEIRLQNRYKLCMKDDVIKDELYSKYQQIADEIKNNRSRAYALLQIAYLAKIMNDFEAVEKYKLKAESIYLNIDKLKAIYQVIQTINVKKEDLLWTLKRFIEEQDILGQAIAITCLGNIAYKNKELEYAHSEYIKALNIFKQIEDRQKEEYLLRCIAAIFNDIGFLAFEKAEFDSAIINYQKALKIESKLGLIEAVAETMRSIGSVYEMIGDCYSNKVYYQKAMDHYVRALVLCNIDGLNGSLIQGAIDVLQKKLT
jgi:tetratricopeptide (TPR) repeat protein